MTGGGDYTWMFFNFLVCVPLSLRWRNRPCFWEFYGKSGGPVFKFQSHFVKFHLTCMNLFIISVCSFFVCLLSLCPIAHFTLVVYCLFIAPTSMVALANARASSVVGRKCSRNKNLVSLIAIRLFLMILQ